MERIIGIDFDNTIVNYDNAMKQVAVERELVGPNVPAQKKSLRDAIRLLPDGETRWQELQAEVYGPGIGRAELIGGVDEFIKACLKLGCPVYIVSHKTEFPERGIDINLRTAAMTWMKNQGFFEANGLGLSEDHVYFETTRREKLSRIGSLNCTHFIDDLEETFLEDSFPADTAKYLYSPHGSNAAIPGVQVVCDWELLFSQILIPTHGGEFR